MIIDQIELVLMCNFYSLIMVFPRNVLFHLIVDKLFSLQNFGVYFVLKCAAKILKMG